MQKIVVINGPNNNRLGKRRPERYGSTTLPQVVEELTSIGARFGFEIIHKQSNFEGELIDFLQEHMDDCAGVIVNPAGLTLYGRPLLDAVYDVKKPTAVVHIAQLYKMGDYYGPTTSDNWKSIADVYVCGLGVLGYYAALVRLSELISGQVGGYAISPKS